MRKTNALILLCLLPLLTNCASIAGSCPKRAPFTGETWGDLAIYTKQLEVIYDACAE